MTSRRRLRSSKGCGIRSRRGWAAVISRTRARCWTIAS
jgi:hypothetical protein